MDIAVAPPKLFSPGYFSDPYPTLAALREEGSLVNHPYLGGPMLFRHADVRALQRCPHLSKGMLRDGRMEGLSEEVQALVRENSERRDDSMLNVDPPRHSRLRGQATSAFTLARMEALRPRIQAIADGLLDALEGQGEIDIIRDFAFPLPATVIMEMLGWPAAQREQLKRCTADAIEMLGSLRTSPDPLELARRAVASGRELRSYAHTLINQKREAPQDDFISALVGVQMAEDGRLNEDEVLATSTLLLAAGHETTTNLIGNGLLALLRNPDQMEKLRADPSLAASAVEEFLRYDPPVQMLARVASADFELGGKTIAAGTRLTLMLGSANRDPAHFPDPDRFDITRTLKDNFAFGFDRHLCLGAHLARIEGQIAITTLLRRFPRIALTGAPLAHFPNLAFRALKALPVLVSRA